MNKRDVVGVLALYLLWLCIAYGVNSVTTGAHTPQAIFEAWVRFDGIYFRAIAEHGYAEASRLTHPEIGFPYLTAFFPLFPSLIRTSAPLFAYNYSVTAVVVPQILTGLALLVLFKLVTLDFPKPVAWLSVLAVPVYPTSYFLLASYSETLFLLLALLAFYAYRQQRMGWAGIIGALAAATRIMGAPLVFGALCLDTACRLAATHSWLWRRLPDMFRIAPTNLPSLTTSRPSTVVNLLPLALIPLGLLTYMGYQGWAFGDPQLFLKGHGSVEWKVGFDLTGPIKGLLLPFVTPFRHPWTSEVFRANYLNSTFFYLGIGLLLYTWRQLPLPHTLYALLAIFAPTLSGSLISMSRYLLVSFSLFISCGLWFHAHPRLRWLLVPLAALSGFTTYLFFKTVFLA